MRTPRNILMHELIGLECEITSATNASQSGATGKIIDETMKNIVLETSGIRKTIPKKGTMMKVALAAGRTEIDCNAIIARPEDRIKKRFRKW